jgi:mannosidase alpha-like ER degradation enhancer 1
VRRSLLSFPILSRAYTLRSSSRLRFALTRSQPGGDGFFVSRVGPYRIPVGQFVHIGDPLVLASIPLRRPEKIQLSASVGDSTLHLPALVANFGPSIASTSPPTGAFAFSEPALPLVTTTFPYGCEPHHHGEGSSSGLDVEGKVLVLRRGMCSFARKANLAALGGAKAVIVINTDSDDDDIVPSADAEERDYKALVPLLLVSNHTGTALEALMASGPGKGSVKAEEATDEVEPMILGGYHVMNVKLQRR